MHHWTEVDGRLQCARCGRIKPGPAVVETMVRHKVVLDRFTVDRARELGDGNLSAGLRRAVRDHHKE